MAKCYAWETKTKVKGVRWYIVKVVSRSRRSADTEFILLVVLGIGADWVGMYVSGSWQLW